MANSKATPVFTLVLASRNRKKSREMSELLSPHGISVVSVSDFPDVPEVEENGETFEANATKKACATAQFLGRWVIAEDSGLCVDALDGAPGVYSARFSGPGATDAGNNSLLIEKLAGVPDDRRTAHYVCHVAVADATGRRRLSLEETCQGVITSVPQGEAGFGYDPYFLIPEYHATFGELGLSVKYAISHRARALRRLLPALRDLVHQMPGDA